jgi:phosphate transport system ATP-binding protein
VDVTETRTRLGLLAQKPFPLPLSIYDNVAYGPRLHGRFNGNLKALVQNRLEAVGLWDLDPISARGIETLLHTLKGKVTVIMVTHDIDQARRLADYVAFMWLGELVEHGPAEPFFAQPAKELSQAYLAREIG